MYKSLAIHQKKTAFHKFLFLLIFTTYLFEFVVILQS